MNYKALDLFIGQGVSHPTLGYGTVHGLILGDKGRAGTAQVGLRTGEHNVPAASLSQAHIPEAELLRLRAKHAKPKTDPRLPRKPRQGTTARRKKVRRRPDIHLGAKAYHAKGRVTIRLVGQDFCLVNFRKAKQLWVQPSELWVMRYANRPTATQLNGAPITPPYAD
jgi:hypothetical protein